MALLLVPAILVSAGRADEKPAPGVSLKARLISKSAASGQGTVAWSPDGQRLAYISKSLVVEEIEGDKRLKSPVKGIYFISWLDDSHLLALRRKGKAAFAALLDASGLLLNEIVMPVAADAAYPLSGFERLLLLSSTMEPINKIGVRTVASAYVFETSGGTYREAFSIDRIQPRALAGQGFIMGWSGAGPSPLDEALVLIEYKDPPALNPYIKAVAVDYITGQGTVMYRLPMGNLWPGGSWSPGGGAVAIPDGDGSLKIIKRTGEAQVLDMEVKGRYAAWSPASDRICFGGHVINPDGSDLVKLKDGARETRCYWRSGGSDVALLDGGMLEFITGADEPPTDGGPGVKAAETIRKVRLLRGLLEDGLVDRKEYDMRFQRLTGIGSEAVR